jgi:hypothetical protein
MADVGLNNIDRAAGQQSFKPQRVYMRSPVAMGMDDCRAISGSASLFSGSTGSSINMG